MLSERDLASIQHWISQMKRSTSKMEKHHDVSKAINALRLNYKILGYGNTRIVYDLENGYVVKVAISRQGLTSNQTEFNLYNRCSTRLGKYLCPVIGHGDGWLIMKKMLRMVSLTEEYEKKLPRLRRRFRKEGIEARSLRSKNLAISDDNRIIVIDYGSFKYCDN